MTKLYEWPPTRSQRARWVLEELGCEYVSHRVDLLAGQQNSDTYKTLHPLSLVPALETSSYSMFESVAIVMQLIDEHPEQNLAPSIGSPGRAHYYQWCVFGCAELDPPVMMVFDNTMRPTKEQYDAKLAARGRRDFARRADILINALRGREYLLGDRFSGADIVIGHSCFMAKHIGLIGNYPELDTYYKRLQHRPAYQRAYSGFD